MTCTMSDIFDIRRSIIYLRFVSLENDKATLVLVSLRFKLD